MVLPEAPIMSSWEDPNCYKRRVYSPSWKQLYGEKQVLNVLDYWLCVGPELIKTIVAGI